MSAVYYEIVLLGIMAEARLTGTNHHPFSDVHVSQTNGSARFVAGYSTLEQDAGSPGRWHFLSHGREAFSIRAVGDAEAPGMVITVPGAVRIVDGTILLGGTGVGLVTLEGHTTASPAGAGTELRIDGRPAVVALVHGPADQKVINRVRLLHSLESASHVPFQAAGIS